MITIRLMGGLGNQLFQFATAYAMAKQKKTTLAVDKRFFKINNQHGGYRLDKLKIPEILVADKHQEKSNWKIKIIAKAPYLDKLLDKRVVHESRFKNVDLLPDDSLLLGYWQNSDYFSSYLSELKNIFLPVAITMKTSIEVGKIQQSNSVSIHIRRGDYLSNPEALRVHGMCSVNYYEKAIAHILEVVDRPTFFVFSDDLSWVENNLSELFANKKIFYMQDNTQEQDLWLMSNAKHHIIANSSFSWWGAYLGSSANQVVISPKPWFNVTQKYTTDPSLQTWKRIDK